MEKSEPRTVGVEALLLQMARQLALPGELQHLGLSKIGVSVALGSIIARAAVPGNRESYIYLALWAQADLGELLDFDFQKSSLDKLYQISDKLLIHKDGLESHFEPVEQQQFPLKKILLINIMPY